MSIDLILLASASCGIGLAITYAWWAKVRIDIFRQRLFRERDNLWLFAFEEDALEDPAYMQARKHINAMINCGPLMSVFTLKRINETGGGKVTFPKTSNERLRSEIKEAYKRSALIGFDYVYLYRLSGMTVFVSQLLGSILVRLTLMQFELWKKSQKRVWLSRRFEDLSRADQEMQPSQSQLHVAA